MWDESTSCLSNLPPENVMPSFQDGNLREFPDRRIANRLNTSPIVERRQFGNSYSELSPDARELAVAIDAYKVEHHRRYITFEEMLKIVHELGYAKNHQDGPIIA